MKRTRVRIVGGERPIDTRVFFSDGEKEIEITKCVREVTWHAQPNDIPRVSLVVIASALQADGALLESIEKAIIEVDTFGVNGRPAESVAF